MIAARSVAAGGRSDGHEVQRVVDDHDFLRAPCWVVALLRKATPGKSCTGDFGSLCGLCLYASANGITPRTAVGTRMGKGEDSTPVRVVFLDDSGDL